MITWQIQNMIRTSDTGYVVEVAWGCTAQQDSASAFHGGVTRYENNPDADGFIPYDQLTEETVLGWVWADVDKDEIESTLNAKVEKQLNPTTENGLPWSQE